jgi:hypothetical protein
MIVDPRIRNPQVSFSVGDVIKYIDNHPKVVVVHRINECDERKNTLTMNARLRLTNSVADHTIFVASWLKDLNVWVHKSSSSVILNGASEIEFPRNSASLWDGLKPLRLVTHHWGANELKGWDVYSQIDKMLSLPKWKNKIKLCYIGNKPSKLFTENIDILEPLTGISLSTQLASHHAYITASQNEPAGMHHIEGAVIGLPLVYRNSGGLPEYCNGYGEMFQGPQDIEPCLDRMLQNYPKWKNKIFDYNNTASRMIFEYLSLFDQLIAQKDYYSAQRKSYDLFTRIMNRLPI